MKQVNNHNHNEESVVKSLKEILAEQIGVEPDDINNEDAFLDDLHMSATDLSDFIENLNKNNIDASNIEITEIKTVNDLIEALSSEELL